MSVGSFALYHLSAFRSDVIRRSERSARHRRSRWLLRATRYTGVSLGFNIGTIAAGGTAPYVAAQLVESTGNAISPAYCVVGVCLIGTVTLLAIRATSKTALPA